MLEVVEIKLLPEPISDLLRYGADPSGLALRTDSRGDRDEFLRDDEALAVRHVPVDPDEREEWLLVVLGGLIVDDELTLPRPVQDPVLSTGRMKAQAKVEFPCPRVVPVGYRPRIRGVTHRER
jgi:hypothetical protein